MTIEKTVNGNEVTLKLRGGWTPRTLRRLSRR